MKTLHEKQLMLELLNDIFYKVEKLTSVDEVKIKQLKTYIQTLKTLLSEIPDSDEEIINIKLTKDEVIDLLKLIGKNAKVQFKNGKIYELEIQDETVYVKKGTDIVPHPIQHIGGNVLKKFLLAIIKHHNKSEIPVFMAR